MLPQALLSAVAWSRGGVFVASEFFGPTHAITFAAGTLPSGDGVIFLNPDHDVNGALSLVAVRADGLGFASAGVPTSGNGDSLRLYCRAH